MVSPSAIVDVDFKFQVNFGAMRVQPSRRPNGEIFAEAQVPYAKIMGCTIRNRSGQPRRKQLTLVRWSEQNPPGPQRAAGVNMNRHYENYFPCSRDRRSRTDEGGRGLKECAEGG